MGSFCYPRTARSRIRTTTPLDVIPLTSYGVLIDLGAEYKRMAFAAIHKFSDLKNLSISKETKIYRHSWKQRAKISVTVKFEEEIL